MTEEKKSLMMVHLDPSQYGLDETKARQIEAAFLPMINKMKELEGEFNRVIKLPISPETCREAKKLRLEYVKVRTGTAVIHKRVKDYYLSGGRFVDGWKNTQLFASQGIEDQLSGIENHFINLERDRIAKLQFTRSAAIVAFDPGFIPENLGEMSDEVWENYFTGVKLSYEQRIKAEQKAEEDRIAQEQSDEEERERIRAENEQLRKETEKKDKQIAAAQAKREKEDAARRKKEVAAGAERKREEEARRKKEEGFKKKLAAERKKREDGEEERKRLELEMKEALDIGKLIKELDILSEDWRKIAEELGSIGKGNLNGCADDLEKITSKYK